MLHRGNLLKRNLGREQSAFMILSKKQCAWTPPLCLAITTMERQVYFSLGTVRIIRDQTDKNHDGESCPLGFSTGNNHIIRKASRRRAIYPSYRPSIDRNKSNRTSVYWRMQDVIHSNAFTRTCTWASLLKSIGKYLHHSKTNARLDTAWP